MLKNHAASISGPELKRRALDAMSALVNAIPGGSVEAFAQADRGRSDFDLTLHWGTHHRRLVCEAKSRAWPNELHAIAHRLLERVRHHGAETATPVLIAPYLSPQAMQACAELGLSWADLAGNGDLRFDGVYVKIVGNPNPYTNRRGTAALYSPQSSRVVHALLLEPRRRWTTGEIARAAGVSLGQVSSVKKTLERHNWIRAVYGETTLSEPRALLEDWTHHYQPKRRTIRLFTLDSPSRLEEKVGTTLSDYAFTELSAAELYAPFTRRQRVSLYVGSWDDEHALTLGLKRGDGPANVTIYEVGGALRFVETVKGYRCASPIQTYLDLRLLDGRGQDAADHLLESVIEPRWN